MVKLNFDGALMDQGGAMGLDIIARDHMGACIDWIFVRLSSHSHAELAEALMPREAILLAHRRGWSKIILERDYATLIHKLVSAACDLSEVGLLMSDILTITLMFDSCHFSFPRRECNSVAHLLAKSGFGSSKENTLLPSVVISLVSEDISS
ncbi:UNVERIFIED_CONTAM: hypothetical protein Sangu_0513900 [Sesamum angustifolium]|uniref:RNase H type-1 domain-containing protein n=1 Tax=Sesamum angustifolium TaxID=2727405 RepID=A0AAW2Q978_9LAMI